jgi:AcrR family transcriptional regulator
MTIKQIAERSSRLDWPESRQSISGLPRGPQAIGRESVQEAQRVRIYFGLAESLAEKGYGATSVADIISRARVSRKSFYEMFRDKEDCFLNLYEHAHERLVQEVLGAQKKGMGWFARLQASHRAYLRFFIDNPQFTYAVLVEVYAAGPVALQRRAQYHAQFVAYQDRKSTRLNSSHRLTSRMPSSA